MTLDDVLPLLHQVRRDGDGWVALCPCHDDRHPSLKLSRGHAQAIIAVCRACQATWPEIRKAIGLEDGSAPYIAPAKDEQEEARRDIIRRARVQRWNRHGIRLLYTASDLHRSLLDRVEALQGASTALGPDDPASWDMLERAATLESERRYLEHGINGIS